MGRITLTLERSTIQKLRLKAIHESVQPCEIVERLLKPEVGPYVLQ